MLWIGSHARTHLPVGLHGAVLPLLLMPAGAVIATWLGILALGQHGVTWFQAFYFPVYVDRACISGSPGRLLPLWKYVVGFVNRVLGIA